MDLPLQRIAQSFPPSFRLRGAALALPLTVGLLALAGPVRAQATAVEMTLERMVELSLTDSYRIRELNYSIERQRYRLRAEEAQLKSSVELEVCSTRTSAGDGRCSGSSA